MSQYRKTIFANDEIYHVYNRGIDKRPTFTSRREYKRAVLTLDYYRYEKPPLRLSKALTINLEERKPFFENLRNKSEKIVEIVAYCLMPNHFHLLLKQKLDNGISTFVSNFTNSYTRFFNTRNKKREGPLFQGVFKAVHIEDNEQLLHIQRYIHINPVVSFIVSAKNLDNYEWSSLQEYVGLDEKIICDKEIILDQFSSIKNYKKFLFDQINYARKLKEIEHLLIE
ncbi:hypothetical protein A2955_04580 [Candidatus Woesebacteria bacterium RIFCSPLOWO2_01_FULL_37_19]|uniref:Transposase IS200-like domain-containing protein n=1 Tax=Candidatus Woesebacteria bacterium RIFCSPLOWO2_01_FULL_37_19 TaxID=1802514 RepID=A0A1F8B227_9BACT|nr:MAG: hypothetical protein A2955_04580 [Candidatus Woesebacteria bacterium RIFCSPLOWO2_01_FULL_37_19]